MELQINNIIKCLQTIWGLKIVSLEFLPLGADVNASVYKAKAEDNGLYFIKVKKKYNYDISLAITKLLHEAGIHQIIAPIKTMYGKHSHCLDHHTLIVYPFIEGEDGFSRKLTNDQWFTLGKTFRQIHEMEVPGSLQIQRETFSNKWGESVRSYLSNDVCKNEIGQKLIEFMHENKEIIQRIVDTSDELRQKAKQQPSKFVLCHTDIHGGNVLINENAIYIVDWDEPLMAPKERDLMFIGGGVANVWNEPLEEKYFYEGYGNTEINRIMLAYYRHERIVVDIAEFCQELFSSNVSQGDPLLMYQHFIEMFEPNGAVEIAFKTEKP